MNNNVILKQLFDRRSSSYSYLLFDSQSLQAILIDPVYERHQRDLSLINELNLNLLSCIETHCHADHITGAWLMKHATSCKIAASLRSGITSLDHPLKDQDTLSFGQHRLLVRETPGHTDGCISLVLNDEAMVFTGDSLLIRGCGRTDFQQGSAENLYHSIKNTLFNLPDHCIVYPAHDYAGRMCSSIGEEKNHNPRIGGDANEKDFLGYMENMQLPHPKQIDIAVPANLKAGRPNKDQLPIQPDWAPVITTFSQILKITPQWVAAHRDQVHILDVRSSEEFNEQNMRIDGAQNIPIDELQGRISEIPDDKPIMTFCRSGKRSTLAFTILQKEGRKKVANIDGGLLRWQEEGLPTI
ncbi:MAG: MBL fold metallo-hydrolase [Gammaproteobacteria bacterium]|nr:MAG: MBL fold metallo-hydrolase [Gammaproteobacteria bacterium]